MARADTTDTLNRSKLIEGRSEGEVFAKAKAAFPEGYRIVSGPRAETEGGINGFFAKRKVSVMVASLNAGNLASLPTETAIVDQAADEEVVELSAAGLRRAEERRDAGSTPQAPATTVQREPMLEDVQIGGPREERAPVYAELPPASGYAAIIPDREPAEKLDRESAREVLRKHGLLPDGPVVIERHITTGTVEPGADRIAGTSAGQKVEPFVVRSVETPVPAPPTPPVQSAPVPAPEPEASEPAEEPVRVIPAPSKPAEPVRKPFVPQAPRTAKERWEALTVELEQEGFPTERVDELVQEARAFCLGVDVKSAVRDALARRLKQAPPTLARSHSMLVVGDRESGKTHLSSQLVKMLHGNGAQVAIVAISPVADPGAQRLLQLAAELDIPYGWTDNPADALVRSLGRYAEFLVVDLYDGNLAVEKTREQVKKLRATLPGRTSTIAALPADRNPGALVDQMRSYRGLTALALTFADNPASRGALAEIALTERAPLVFACDAKRMRTLDPSSLAKLLIP